MASKPRNESALQKLQDAMPNWKIVTASGEELASDSELRASAQARSASTAFMRKKYFGITDIAVTLPSEAAETVVILPKGSVAADHPMEEKVAILDGEDVFIQG